MRVTREKAGYSRNTAPLSDILRCKACGKAMFHTYAMRGKYKYRYYVCQSVQKQGSNSCPTKSVNAQAIEDSVIDCLGKMPQKELTEILAIWDALFPQLKHEALKRMVKEVKYDGTTGKLDMVLNNYRFYEYESKI
ncbi:MAG: zinc ribbon domain-containing protein [Candidatus Omnitrophica bacterium]|nr:zinc ribbon domain-containing protein [Candidatus Omnitrophota bacterium]